MKSVVFQANSSMPPISATAEGNNVEPMKASIACSATPPVSTQTVSPPSRRKSPQLAFSSLIARSDPFNGTNAYNLNHC